MARFRGKNNFLGAWAYVLLGILYAIPVIGFVFMLVHSFSTGNENLRHYARSCLLRLVLCIVLAGIGVALILIFSGTDGLNNLWNSIKNGEAIKNIFHS